MSMPILTPFDLHLIGEGTHYRTYEKLGAHPCVMEGTAGVAFRVWAPGAERLSVIGDFNGWNPGADPMSPCGDSGVWERFVPGVAAGALYKFRLESRYLGYRVDKADPFAFASQIRPETASVVWGLTPYAWTDSVWMDQRSRTPLHTSPMSIYEAHLGSWRRIPEEGNRWLRYDELAEQLADYLNEMGFTHIELMPVAEHPFDGSWGYQTVGYFAPTSRFGSPDDFKGFVNTLHRRGIGVILDWVPAHFPRDEHGLGFFDGTHLYEHADSRQGLHPDWDTFVFNYGRLEVRNFLISNALFWIEQFHIDGLRVDAVASMLYLDYGRSEGQWIPNQYGGKENIEAIDFIRVMNERIYADSSGVMTIAEESTSWPGVSQPTYVGGLGFGFKWNMGWMHDMLDYMSQDPVHRSYHHNRITFSMLYAFSENFILPFSHDEVVHGKRSMIDKMPGDRWQKFANLRLLYGYMFGHPGKKLLFMGGEFGQWQEWDHDSSLDWHLLSEPDHAGLQRWVRDLNHFYRSQPLLYEVDSDSAGFEWIDCNDTHNSVVSFLRQTRDRREIAVFVCNFTPVVRRNFRIGVPEGGFWRETLNSDAPFYGGSGQGNSGGVEASPVPAHGRPESINITVPPLAIIVFQKGGAQ
ncbi:MAG TPA: 1,4-alpha-glucan branching protein GlgB [Terriglobia bacterium]|nr:1,4-alpha-glucan branching protein GlgB [Terriglobia bacterium]